MNVPRVGVGVLIFDHHRLLLGQRQQSHGNGTWGPPGGHLEFGETFQECALREAKEETGLVIVSPEVVAITNDVFQEANKHYVSIFMKAKHPIDQTVQNIEKDKVIAWEWFNINAIPNNLFLPLKTLLQEKGEGFLLRLQASFV